uniref:Uncharacterized protein n=1 Tax=Arundo donax TaxID=35708 RepID=A0A0A9G5E2_ARUDO
MYSALLFQNEIR